MSKFTKPVILFVLFCSGLSIINGQNQKVVLNRQDVVCGADRFEMYFPSLKDKKVGLVGNRTSVAGGMHLLDQLVSKGVYVNAIFSPEHGFRGDGEAGELISDYRDPQTGVRVISLYGAKKKPDKEDLKGLDIVLFDIQDVGARFYTYISTLHYIMEACAENNIPLIVLDRPNPNGFYIDGPVREERYKSFVGMHPVPVVHGMTIGEYARMINGEKWLPGSLQCDLTIIPCLNYDHHTEYVLPVAPSPNLPNQKSVYLYPTLCFFEGTVVSVGRGTKVPFQIYGHPDYDGSFVFRPVPTPGASMEPKWKNRLCRGVDLRNKGLESIFLNPGLQIEWIIDIYRHLGEPDNFFTGYFDTLAGTARLRQMIVDGYSSSDIRNEWKVGIENFVKIRQKYLLYNP